MAQDGGIGPGQHPRATFRSPHAVIGQLLDVHGRDSAERYRAEFGRDHPRTVADYPSSDWGLSISFLSAAMS